MKREVKLGCGTEGEHDGMIMLSPHNQPVFILPYEF